MTATFAALEARTVVAVFSRLANADATAIDIHGELVTFPVIFDAAGQNAGIGGGLAITSPMVTLSTSDVPEEPVGWEITVNDIRYTVAAHEPDGTGLSRLILERSA